MFGFPPLSRRSSSRRAPSPLGSSRFEQPMPERYERYLRRDSSRPERSGYGEPDLTRVESRSYREYPSRRHEPETRSSSRRAPEYEDYSGVDLSGLAGGFNPSGPRPSTRSTAMYVDRNNYDGLDRLHESSCRGGERSAADYLDRLGSRYERKRYPSSSRREPEREYYSSSSFRRDGYGSSSRGGSVADMLGGLFGGASSPYLYPDDDNRCP